MKVLHYTVKGDPRTKKNSMMIAGSGQRCPTCHKFKKQWIRQSEASDVYSESAVWYLKTQRRPRRPIDFRVNVCYKFFTKIDYQNAKASWDMDNHIVSMNDILKKAGIIKDDHIRIVAGHDGSRQYCDPKNPRVEIYITRMPDETPEQLKFLKGD